MSGVVSGNPCESDAVAVPVPPVPPSQFDSTRSPFDSCNANPLLKSRLQSTRYVCLCAYVRVFLHVMPSINSCTSIVTVPIAYLILRDPSPQDGRWPLSPAPRVSDGQLNHVDFLLFLRYVVSCFASVLYPCAMPVITRGTLASGVPPFAYPSVVAC